MVREARRASYLPSGVWRVLLSWAWWSVQLMRASRLISALGVDRRRLQDGDRGVPTNVVRPLVLGRLASGAGSNRVAGSWSQIIDSWTPLG
jgi:hypothetical protein